MTEKSARDYTSFLINFFSGGFAGIIAKTIAAPVERVKLLLQTQKANAKVSKKYTGITDCFIRTYREEGVLSFWRGNGVNIIRYFPTQALNFSFKEYFGHIFIKSKKEQAPYRFFSENILAGGCAGSMTTVIVYPLDFARTRVGVDIGRNKEAREFKGMADCMKKIYLAEGIRGLYNGFPPAIVGIFVYRGLYFGMYDTGKAVFFKDREVSFFTKFFFAQFVVISSETVAYPTDTVKRRLMMQSGKKEKIYDGWLDCTKKIAKQEGFKAFFTGNLSNVVRSFGSSLCLVLFDVFQAASNEGVRKMKKH